MITLLHIYGPFAIQSYGATIVLGIVLTLYFFKKDKPLLSKISFEQLLNLISLVIVCGVAGARLLYVAEHGAESFLDLFAVWDGGLSVFGALIANLILIPLYLRSYAIPVMFILDRVSIYIPLLHGIARIGCALAGCCYGRETTSWFHVLYTSDSMAPLHTPLIPVQLLSVLGLFCIFVFLYCHHNMYKNGSGFLFGSYLLSTGILRALLDSLRANHYSVFAGFSHNQIIALCIALLGLIITIQSFKAAILKNSSNL